MNFMEYYLFLNRIWDKEKYNMLLAVFTGSFIRFCFLIRPNFNVCFLFCIACIILHGLSLLCMPC